VSPIKVGGGPQKERLEKEGKDHREETTEGSGERWVQQRHPDQGNKILVQGKGRTGGRRKGRKDGCHGRCRVSSMEKL